MLNNEVIKSSLKNIFNEKVNKLDNTVNPQSLKKVTLPQLKWTIIESPYPVSSLYDKLYTKMTKTLWITDNLNLISFIVNRRANNTLNDNIDYNTYYKMLTIGHNVYIFMQHFSFINELINKYRWALIVVDIGQVDISSIRESNLFLLLKRLKNYQRLILITSLKVSIAVKKYFSHSILTLKQPTIDISLNFKVLTENGRANKLLRVLILLKNIKGKGLIFVSHREEGEVLQAFLESSGYLSTYIDNSKVNHKYLKDRFLYADNHLYPLKIIITNNIDSIPFTANEVNWVIHYNFSSSVSDYLKELNWVTSKSNKTDFYIFYNYQDKILRESLIKERSPDFKSMRMVYYHIKNSFRWGNHYFVSLDKYFSNLRLSNKKLQATLKVLAQKNIIRRKSYIISYAKILIDSYTFRDYPKYLSRVYSTEKQGYLVIDVFDICKNINISPIFITRSLLELEQQNKVLFLERHLAETYYIIEDNVNQVDTSYGEIRELTGFYNSYNELDKLEKLIQKKRVLNPSKDNILDITNKVDNSTMTGKVILGILFVLNESLLPLGKCLVADVLTGSASKKVKRLGLHELSLYSAFSLVKTEYIKELVVELILNGLLEEIFIKNTFIRGLKLSNKGVELVEKEAQFNKFFWEAHKQSFSNKKGSYYLTIKEVIYNGYKGKVSDNILRSIAYMMPKNKKELSMVKGIKCDQVNKLAPLVLSNTSLEYGKGFNNEQYVAKVEEFISNEFYPSIEGDFTKGYSLSYYTSISKGKRSYTAIGKIVHGYKYKNKKEVNSLIKNRVLSLFEKEKDFLLVDLICVVPSHKKYPSITLELARWVSSKLGIPFYPDLIVQTRDSNHQKTLDTLDKRVNNSTNLFSTSYNDLIKNHSILVMDDIYDSGTTANECTRCLRVYKASKVYLLTCTKTTYRDT